MKEDERIHITIDSREQNPYEFKRCKSVRKTSIQGLKTGDYSMFGYDQEIAIERKSAQDLFGTLGKGYKRFKKELIRAKELAYFAIIIEESYTNIRNKKFKNSFRSTMRGHVIMKTVHTLNVKYGINVFFANDRKEAERIVEQTLLAYHRLKLKEKKQ